MSVPRFSRNLAGNTALGAAIAAILLAGAPRVAAAPPRLGSITPRGGQRGAEVTIVIDGDGLAANPELLIGIPAPKVLVAGDPYPPTPKRIAFRFRIQETDAAGVYPLRVRTDEGLSNPLLFMVGQFPEIVEAEPNDLPPDARPIEPPVTINGSLGASDRDTFRFSARKGERLTLEVEARRIGSAVDPALLLLAANGRELAISDDAYGLDVDSRLDFTFPEDGEYLVQLHDAMFAGRNPSFYRLKIGPIAYADGIFPLGGRRGSEVLVRFDGGNLAGPVVERVRLDLPVESWVPVGLPPAVDSAGTLPFPLRIGDLPEMVESARPSPDAPLEIRPPVTINGRLEAAGEIDRYALAVKPGERWVFDVEAYRLGSWLDGLLSVLNEKGDRLAQADDSGRDPDPRLEFQVPEGAGKIILALEDLNRRGGPAFAYRLTVERHRPDFLLVAADPVANIPLKGTQVIEVEAVRRGFNDAIDIEVLDVPGGFTVKGGRMLPGQTKGYISISAPPAGKLRSLDLVVRGRGGPPEDPITAIASSVLLAQEGSSPGSPWRQDRLAAAVASPQPLGLQAEEGTIEVVRGHGRPVRIEARRAEGASAEIKLQGLTGVPGLGAAEGKIAEGASQGTIVFNAAPDAPLGLIGDAAVRGTIKLDGGGVAVAAPVFEITVVPPFALELAAAAAEGPLGGKAAISGKIARRAPFAGEVEVKLEGLPGGAAGGPVKVPGGEAGFTVEITLGDLARPGKVDLRVIATGPLGDPKKPVLYSAPAQNLSLTIRAAEAAPGK